MRFKIFTTAISAAVAISLLGATAASAATEAGNRCAANEASEGIGLIGLANASGNPLPATIPVNGVITRWTLNLDPEIPSGIVSQRLKIFRATGSPNQYKVVGESSSESINGGLNNFSTRIPVLAGDRIGNTGSAFGKTFGLYCETGNSGDRVGAFAGDAPLNSTVTVEEEGEGYQSPTVVSIEADADNDGFGDETQDLCPQSALFQTACPPVTLSNFSQVKKGSVIIVVTPSTTAPVSVFGVVGLGKGKKVTLIGGTQTLAPGLQGKFVLKFTKRLNKKLAKLSRKRSLKLNVTVAGTSVTGAVTTSTLKLTLKGRAKP